MSERELDGTWRDARGAVPHVEGMPPSEEVIRKMRDHGRDHRRATEGMILDVVRRAGSSGILNTDIRSRLIGTHGAGISAKKLETLLDALATVGLVHRYRRLGKAWWVGSPPVGNDRDLIRAAGDLRREARSSSGE